MSPGPFVTAMRSMSRIVIPARAHVSDRTGIMLATCSRAAIFGTTPPHCAWVAIWEETTFAATDNFPRSARTMAPAVSSQEVSMPKMWNGLFIGCMLMIGALGEENKTYDKGGKELQDAHNAIRRGDRYSDTDKKQRIFQGNRASLRSTHARLCAAICSISGG